jgi:hypothetical protein
MFATDAPGSTGDGTHRTGNFSDSVVVPDLTDTDALVRRFLTAARVRGLGVD